MQFSTATIEIVCVPGVNCVDRVDIGCCGGSWSWCASGVEKKKITIKMGSMVVEGANPIIHLLNRQIGNNIDYFRRNLFRERLASARNLYRKNLVSHYGCVNAIEFSSVGDLLISGILFECFFSFCLFILNLFPLYWFFSLNVRWKK